MNTLTGVEYTEHFARRFGPVRVEVGPETVIIVEPFEAEPLDYQRAESFMRTISDGELLERGYGDDWKTGDSDVEFRIYARRIY